MGNTLKTLLISKDNNYILVESLSRKQGISSTQIDRSAMLKACLASKWVGLLPLRPTCEKSTHLKEWDMATEL